MSVNAATALPPAKIWAERLSFGDRFAMWWTDRQSAPQNFAHPPLSLPTGDALRGRGLLAGRFALGGYVLEAPAEGDLASDAAQRKALWQIDCGQPRFWAAVCSADWLADLAALGSIAARERARDWLLEGAARSKGGVGPAWVPEVTARRIVAVLGYSEFLRTKAPEGFMPAMMAGLSRDYHYLSRAWGRLEGVALRLEALSALIMAALALGAGLPLSRLDQEIESGIEADGAIASRNPEAHLQALVALLRIRDALVLAKKPPSRTITSAIERMTPIARALRHSDGGLARFHGGGAGPDGLLDRALADSGIKKLHDFGQPAMGYLRLSAGRTSVIIDAASPPAGVHAKTAHASTLAFEMSSGRRPLIVSCGSGLGFGPQWAKAGRATVSHSTLFLEGSSSSRLDPSGSGVMVERAAVSSRKAARSEEGFVVELSHDGWLVSHGLRHERLMLLSPEGGQLGGHDRLFSPDEQSRKRYAELLSVQKRDSWPFSLRFHLHPEVEVKMAAGESVVSLLLRSGELWLLRHDGRAELSLEPSVYLEEGATEPRASKQIVLSTRMDAFEVGIGWTLAKAQDSAGAIRDLERDDPLLVF